MTLCRVGRGAGDVAQLPIAGIPRFLDWLFHERTSIAFAFCFAFAFHDHLRIGPFMGVLPFPLFFFLVTLPFLVPSSFVFFPCFRFFFCYFLCPKPSMVSSKFALSLECFCFHFLQTFHDQLPTGSFARVLLFPFFVKPSMVCCRFALP